MRVNDGTGIPQPTSTSPAGPSTAPTAPTSAANVIATPAATPDEFRDEGPRGPARTPEQALADADTLLRGERVDRPSSANGATIEYDPADSNDLADTDPASVRHQTAKTQVQGNAALERQQLAAVSPEDRARYEQVRSALRAGNDPVAEVALQKMLFQGKIPGEKDLTGEGTTLEHLARLSDPKTPLVDGVDRNQLVADLTQELATPSSINQRAKNTCAPTTVTIHLAMNNPAEFARLVGGLTSPEGKVKLAGGDTLEREPGTAADDGSGRSVVQRILTPAFMEQANGRLNYDNEKDKHTLFGVGLFPGAAAIQVDRLLEGVYGRKFEHRTLVTWGQMDNIRDQVKQGETVPVTLKFGDNLMSWHKVLVTGVDTVDGKEHIRYVNPWGREERMSADEFKDRLKEVNWDPGNHPTPKPQSPPLSPYRYGGGVA